MRDEAGALFSGLLWFLDVLRLAICATTAAAMFDSQVDFFTGKEHMTVTVAGAEGPDWSKPRHLKMFNDATTYMHEDNKLMKHVYRTMALEKLDDSVEAFISWFERTSKVCVSHLLASDVIPSCGCDPPSLHFD